VLVQAALVLPLLVGLLFTSINIFIAGRKLLALQDIVAEVTKETFTKTKAQRGELDWQPFFETSLFLKAKAAGADAAIKPGANAQAFWGSTAAQITYTPSTKRPGDTVSFALTATEPIFRGIGGSAWLPSISMELKAVAVIQMREDQ
jgi:Flp pilus assembly protein TadG